MKIDSHSHSRLSHDGQLTIEALAKKVKAEGFSYLAITEHLDRDYRYGGIRERLCRQLDLSRYDRHFKKAKENVSAEDFYLAYGLEIGYGAKCAERCFEEVSKYEYDVVINSIHTLGGKDMYFKDFFDGKRQEYVYHEYLDTLHESLSAPYHYDIIGHIGYVARYAPYDEPSLLCGKYDEKLKVILSEIITKDKTIEVNTHITHPIWQYLPEKGLLEMYRKLGGTRITYSSDSHHVENIGKNYALVSETLLALGFKEWTIYRKGEAVTVPITIDSGNP